MTSEPRQCVALDAVNDLLPGTSAMRLLTRDVVYRQSGAPAARWIAEPENAIDVASDTGGYPLRGVGTDPSAAMADLWEKGTGAGALIVHPPGGREPFDVRWDDERGWSVP